MDQIPMYLLAFALTQATLTDDRLYKVSMIDFRAETYLPVTPRRIWLQGEDVTKRVQANRVKLIRLLRSGPKGSFDQDFVRLGVATMSGYSMYVDRFGGVRMPDGDRKLGKGQLAAMKRLLPDLAVATKHIRLGSPLPPGSFTIP